MHVETPGDGAAMTGRKLGGSTKTCSNTISPADEGRGGINYLTRCGRRATCRSAPRCPLRGRFSCSRQKLSGRRQSGSYRRSMFLPVRGMSCSRPLKSGSPGRGRNILPTVRPGTVRREEDRSYYLLNRILSAFSDGSTRMWSSTSLRQCSD